MELPQWLKNKFSEPRNETRHFIVKTEDGVFIGVDHIEGGMQHESASNASFFHVEGREIEKVAESLGVTPDYIQMKLNTSPSEKIFFTPLPNPNKH